MHKLHKENSSCTLGALCRISAREVKRKYRAAAAVQRIMRGEVNALLFLTLINALDRKIYDWVFMICTVVQHRNSNAERTQKLPLFQPIIKSQLMHAWL